jgi:hypothetical protein
MLKETLTVPSLAFLFFTPLMYAFFYVSIRFTFTFRYGSAVRCRGESGESHSVCGRETARETDRYLPFGQRRSCGLPFLQPCSSSRS